MAGSIGAESVRGDVLTKPAAGRRQRRANRRRVGALAFVELQVDDPPRSLNFCRAFAPLSRQPDRPISPMWPMNRPSSKMTLSRTNVISDASHHRAVVLAEDQEGEVVGL